MTLSEFSSIKENRGKIVKMTDLMLSKRYYLGLYHRYLIELYDKGYLSDPTIWNQEEVEQNIGDLEIEYLINEYGRVLTDEKAVHAVRDYYKANEPQEDRDEFLSLLYKAIHYRGISSNIDNFYENSKPRVSGRRRVSLKYNGSDGEISELHNIVIDEGILKAEHGLSFTSRFTSYGKGLIKLVQEILKTDSADFVKGFTPSQTANNLEMILKGVLPLNEEEGTAGYVLSTWFNEHRTTGLSNTNFWDWMHKEMPEEVLKAKEKLICKDVISITSDGVYKESKSLKSTMEYPAGHFIFVRYVEKSGVTMAYNWYYNQRFDVYELEGVLPEMNSLTGYTGQVYSADFLLTNHMEYKGVPIQLYNEQGILEDYIDIEQTELYKNETMFHEYGTVLDWEDSTRYDQIPEELSDKLTSNESRIYDLHLHKGEGKLSTTIECADKKLTADEVDKAICKMSKGWLEE